MILRVEHWGRLEYDEAHRKQRERIEQVRRRPGEGFLCLTEHPPVYTIGRFGRRENRIDPAVELRKVERGGDITYHGPGQAVGYVILRLRGFGVRELIDRIERMLADAAAAFGVEASGDPRGRGLWVDGRKMASIGLAIRGGITWHGFAWNVSTDLSAFAAIHPCGMPGVRMTSLVRETGRSITLTEAAGAVDAAAPRYLERERSVTAEM